MLDISDQNRSPFEKKVRVRVCGVLEKDNEILLLKHLRIGPGGYLWSPPGGGVEFGQSLVETLKREFLEETHLRIEVEEHLFTNEHLDDVHHAIEFFFRVRLLSGDLKLGEDPELASDRQMLADAQFFSSQALKNLPLDTVHAAFHPLNPRYWQKDRGGLITFED